MFGLSRAPFVRFFATLIALVVLLPWALSCTEDVPRHSERTTSKTMPWGRVIEARPNPAIIPNEEVRDAITRSGFPWRILHESTGIELVLIPPGTFVMGRSLGDDESLDSELPPHRVVISEPLYVSRTEVTQAQWSRLVPDNPSRAQHLVDESRSATIDMLLRQGMTREEAAARIPRTLVASGLQGAMPVTGLGEAGPQLFDFLALARLSLPTEAQWEYASRAGVRSARYGEIDSIAWTDGRLHPVGQLKPNDFGLYDTIGNALELCSDCYYGDAYSRRRDGVTDPTSDPHQTPAGWPQPTISEWGPGGYERMCLERDAEREGISYGEALERRNSRLRFLQSNPVVRGGFDAHSCRASWRSGLEVIPSVDRDRVGVRVVRFVDNMTVDWEAATIHVHPTDR